MVGNWSSTNETTTVARTAQRIHSLFKVFSFWQSEHKTGREDNLHRTVGKRSLWGNLKCLSLVGANRLRVPQMEAVMMFKFISASLWGCMGPVYSSLIPLYYVTIITLTVALTCPLNSVSATCWGSYN